MAATSRMVGGRREPHIWTISACGARCTCHGLQWERMMAGMRTSDWQMRQTDTHKEQTRPQKMNITAQIRKCENLQR